MGILCGIMEIRRKRTKNCISHASALFKFNEVATLDSLQ